jgi:hypothetical protein
VTAVKRLALIWTVLMLATAAGWLIGELTTAVTVLRGFSSNALILLIAAGKAYLVMNWFMELREAAALVRWAGRSWLFFLVSMLLVLLTQVS